MSCSDKVPNIKVECQPTPKKQTGMDVLKKSFTAAQKVFTGVTILNERPEGMSFDEYKRLRRDQRKALKQVGR